MRILSVRACVWSFWCTCTARTAPFPRIWSACLCMWVRAWVRGWRRDIVFPGLSLKELKLHDEIICALLHQHTHAHTLQNAIKLNTKFIWHVRTLFSISGVELSSAHDHSFILFYPFIHSFLSFYAWFVFYRLSLPLSSLCVLFFNVHIWRWLNLLRVIYINSDKLFRPHTNIHTAYKIRGKKILFSLNHQIFSFVFSLSFYITPAPFYAYFSLMFTRIDA